MSLNNLEITPRYPLDNLKEMPKEGVWKILGQKGRQTGDAEKVAKDFESIFIERLMQSMTKSIDKSGLVEDSAIDQMKELFNTYMSQEMAKGGGLGLWKQIASQYGGNSHAASSAIPHSIQELGL